MRISTSEKAYREIQKKIIRLEYPPGMQLEEKRLMLSLGLGRTPIREALIRLQEELLISSVHKKGYVIKPITLQGTKAVFEALCILESCVAKISVESEIQDQLAGMACANEQAMAALNGGRLAALFEANRAYHALFAECSFNPFLTKGLNQIGYETERLNHLILKDPPADRNTVKDSLLEELAQHNQILEAMRAKDRNRIEKLIIAHNQLLKDRIAGYLS